MQAPLLSTYGFIIETSPCTLPETSSRIARKSSHFVAEILAHDCREARDYSGSFAHCGRERFPLERRPIFSPIEFSNCQFTATNLSDCNKPPSCTTAIFHTMPILMVTILLKTHAFKILENSTDSNLPLDSEEFRPDLALQASLVVPWIFCSGTGSDETQLR